MGGTIEQILQHIVNLITNHLYFGLSSPKKATRFPLFLLWKDGGDDETGRGGESGGEGGGGEHLLPLRLFPLWLSHSASCLLWRNWKASNTIITNITITVTNITFPDWATLCALTPTWWLCTGGSDIRCFCRKSSTAGQTQFYQMHDKDENMSIPPSAVFNGEKNIFDKTSSRSPADQAKPYLTSVFRLKSLILYLKR